MKNIWAICKKEVKTYFTSPIAYVLITVFLVLVGSSSTTSASSSSSPFPSSPCVFSLRKRKGRPMNCSTPLPFQ